MKKVFIVLVGIITLSMFAYLISKDQVVLQTDQEFERSSLENKSQSGNKDKNNTAKGVDIDKLLEELNFESRGGKCKELEVVLERGDCFQEVHSIYLDWWYSLSKEDFYFPIQNDRSNIQDIMYFNIEDTDELSGFTETDFFNEYDESVIEDGKEWMHEYWYIFSSIIPREHRKDLKSIYWRDAQGEAAMFMGRDSDELKEFSLSIESNIGKYDPYMKYLFFHEFGHMLTLDEGQVEINEDLFLEDEDNEEVWAQEEALCSNFYSVGCHKENSYLNEFYNMYWLDIEDDYGQINWDDEHDYQAFFSKNEDRFFNSYQGTSPIEDIAESFAFFIMLESERVERESDMKYGKAYFFYQFDELVDLRTMILENIYDLSIKDDRKY